MLKISGKAGREIAENAGRSLAKAAPEARVGLRGWWTKGIRETAETSGKETVEEATKHVDNIMKDMSAVRGIATKTSKEITENISSANKELSNAVKSLNSSKRANAAELDRIHRHIMQQEKLEPERQVESVIDALRERRAVLDGQVKLETRQLDELSDILRTSINPGQEASAMRMFTESAVEGVHSVPGVLQWQSQMQATFMKNRQVLNMSSKNLSSDTRFLQEYLSLKRNPAAAEKLELWTANPKNFNKLEQLMQRDKIFSIVEKGKMKLRHKIFGVSLSDTAKRLAIGTGAVAASAGAIKVYSWFNDNDPSKTAAYGSRVGSSLASIRTRGAGASILRVADASMKTMTKAANEVNSNLSGDNAAESAKKFIETMADELPKLHTALEQWEIVVKNSDNPDQAMAVREELYVFVDKMARGLASLGVSVKGVAGRGQRMPGGALNKNIQQVQEFIGVPQSGKLDQQTVNALRAFENDLNNSAATTKFTGLFVVPEENFVADIDDLRAAQRKVQRY